VAPTPHHQARDGNFLPQERESIMARTGSSVRKRVWRKVVVALMVGVVAIGSLIFWQRYKLAVWYLEGNKKTQEMLILLMLEYAKPIIERDLKMTLPEKIFSTIAGKRNEKERQTDALKDVRRFGELSFENHWLKFKDVHNLSSMNGYNLHGFNVALGWNRGNTDEVLAAFNVNFLKRKIGKMQINDYCSFFTELKLYIDKKAKEN
jgi:hypothetical protein